jgi:hypothetical protein
MENDGAQPELDRLWMDRAVARIWKITWAVGAGGLIAATAWKGWRWGAGWAIGCGVSALNFRWLKQMVDAVGTEGGKPRKAVFLGLRYVLLGGGAYVILEFSAISLAAAFSGLFVAVAAVILEIVVELAYARNGTIGH